MDIRSPPSVIFRNLTIPTEIQKWFPDFYVVDKDHEIDLNFIEENNIQYIAKIINKEEYSLITGTIESVDNQEDKLQFEWLLEQNSDVVNWTRLTINLTAPSTIKRSKWWILTLLGTLPLIKLFEDGLSNMQEAYAFTSIMPSTTSTTSSVASSSITATTSTTSILSTKPILASIVAAMLVTSGVYIAEPDIFVPNITSNPDATNTSQSSVTNSIQDSSGISSSSAKGGSSSSSSHSASSTSVSQATSTPQSVQNPEQVQTEQPVEESLITEVTTTPTTVSSSGGGSSSGTSTTSTSTSTNTNTGTDSTSSGIVAANLSQVTGAVVDSNGLVFVMTKNVSTSVNDDSAVISSLTQHIEVHDPTLDAAENPVTTFGSFAQSESFGPHQIAIDGNDNIYVTEMDSQTITKYAASEILSSSSNQLTSDTEPQVFQLDIFPLQITTDQNNNPYVLGIKIIQNSIEYQVSKLNSDGTTGPPLYKTTEMNNPSDMAINNSDNLLYIADSGLNTVFQVDLGNKEELEQITQCNGIALNSPEGLAVDKNILYVADSGNNRILKYESQNDCEAFGESGNGIDQFSKPTKIDIDKNGILYVTDTLNDRIQTVSFEDAVESFSKQFDAIMCNAGSMINNPVSVPPEIASALPNSELLSRANNLADTEQFDESLFFYYIASQIQPSNIHAWNGIGYSQTFVCDNNSPIDAYQNTLTLDANNINALNGLGFFYTNQAQLQSQNNAPDDLIESTANLAVSNYEKSLDLDSNNINALNGLGTIHIILEQYAKAIEFFVVSFGLNPEKITTLNGLANAHLKSGNLVLSESFYEDALDIDSNNFDALSGLLLIYIQQDDQHKVNEAINRLAQFQEQVVESLIAEGEWFLERGSTDEAIRFFEKALELDPGNESVRFVESILNS